MQSLNSVLYLIFCGMTTMALLIVLNLLLPSRVESAREKLESHSIRCLVIGLVALGLALAVLLLLGYLINLPVLQIMATENVPYWMAVHSLIRVLLTLLLILLALGLAGVTAIGLAALAKSLGQRTGNAVTSNHASLLGAGLLVISVLAPYVGWFVFAPIALGISFGANIQALFDRKSARSPKAVV